MDAKIEVSKQDINSFMGQLNKICNTAVNRTMDIVSTRIGLAFDRYTPMNTGYLRNSKHISVKGNNDKYTVNYRYDAPYAKYQYENKGGRFKKYTTPGTGDHWAEKAADEIKEIITKELLNQLQ